MIQLPFLILVGGLFGAFVIGQDLKITSPEKWFPKSSTLFIDGLVLASYETTKLIVDFTWTFGRFSFSSSPGGQL